MSRKFIAFIAGTAIALTALTAAPARADNEDAAKALALLLGLAVVGKVISDRNDRDKGPAVHPTPRPRPDRVHRSKLLPYHCFRTFNARHKQIRGFGARCLERNYRHAHSLPRHCATRVETRRGWGWAYGARCLRKQGYKLARN